MSLQPNQLVRIKVEFRDGPEDIEPQRVVELRGDRCVIEPLTWPYGPLTPQETVECSMLEVVS